ncbi:MAG: hypothetical protein M3297_07445 [Thermoproteota archaeon]|nr:hypothetical protein [Thermoproteota archaeon]
MSHFSWIWHQGQCIKAAQDRYREKEITRMELEERKDECKKTDFRPKVEVRVLGVE